MHSGRASLGNSFVLVISSDKLLSKNIDLVVSQTVIHYSCVPGGSIILLNSLLSSVLNFALRESGHEIKDI